MYSAGFEDHSTTAIDLDKKDDAYDPQTYESLLGIRMPDGIAAFTVEGTTYLVTAIRGRRPGVGRRGPGHLLPQRGRARLRARRA